MRIARSYQKRRHNRGAALGPRVIYDEKTRGPSPTNEYLKQKSAFHSVRKQGQFGHLDLPAGLFPTPSKRQKQLLQEGHLRQRHSDGLRKFGSDDHSNIWKKSSTRIVAHRGTKSTLPHVPSRDIINSRGRSSKKRSITKSSHSLADVLAASMSDEDVLLRLRQLKDNLLAGLRKRAARANKRSHNIIETMQAMFHKLDLDKSGSIDASEFKSLIFAVAPGCTDEQLSVLMATIDGDGSGQIELKEITSFLDTDVERLTVRRRKKRYHKQLQLPSIMGRTDRILQDVATRRAIGARSAYGQSVGVNSTVAGSMKGYLKKLGLLDTRARRQKFDAETRLVV